MSIRNLDSLFDPGSVAVIGASSRPDSVGATVWRNLAGGRFKGPLFAVNPKCPALSGGLVVASLLTEKTTFCEGVMRLLSLAGVQ